MVGIPPPSSSMSSRVRYRQSPTSSSPSSESQQQRQQRQQQRRTIVASNAVDGRQRRMEGTAPLESVVVVPNDDVVEFDRERIDGDDHDDDGKSSSSNAADGDFWGRRMPPVDDSISPPPARPADDRTSTTIARDDEDVAFVVVAKQRDAPRTREEDGTRTTTTIEGVEEDGVTNVRVCVRLRPMITRDHRDATTTPDYDDDDDAAMASPSSSGGTSSRMKRHASGLATPTSTSRILSPKVVLVGSERSSNQRRTTAVEQKQQQQHAPPPLSSSSFSSSSSSSAWHTHPNDIRRITQSKHTAPYTSHRDVERMADYSYDRVFGPSDTTSTLYDECVRGVVKSFVDGYHGSVFAYGQTNSGKTHTMTGSPDEAGVIRLAVRDIFRRIRSSQSAPVDDGGSNDVSSREYLVRVSYLEIYNEQIYDLLAQPPRPSASPSRMSLQHHHLPPSTSVRIFESRTEGVVVRGLREEIVTCPGDVYALLDAGNARRRVGSTGMNRTSSRSHSVFRIVLESRASSSSSRIGGGGGPELRGGSGGGVPSIAPASNSSVNSDSDSVATQQSQGASVRGPVRISSMSLVDLAGSESVKNTGSTGVRQKEGQYINKSLLTLGHVVHKLSELSSREKGAMVAPNEHIPYRDSKLTRLLQPSLGGNAQVCIICNISPALSNLEESHNTLKFALRAKKIRQHARITEVTDEKTLLRSYREEIEELKRQLREATRTSSDTQDSQQRHRQSRLDQTPKVAVDYSSSSDEEDQDDTQVLVSAIANLESLILKAGAKSTRKATKTTVRSNSSMATTSDDGNDESSLPSRALDAALMRAESPAVASDSPTTNGSSLMTPETTQRVEHGDEDDQHLLEDLHRIQEMLGAVMKKKLKGGGVKTTPGGGNSINVNNLNGRTPDRDAEVERLRMQLQEQEVTSAMRKADSSFLQSQLNVKDGILKEVSILLEALEKRQLALETENKQLREDLAGAANMIEEADAMRLILEQRLLEKDVEIVEKKSI